MKEPKNFAEKSAVPCKQAFLLVLSDKEAAIVTHLSHWQIDALLSWGIHSEEIALQRQTQLIFLY